MISSFTNKPIELSVIFIDILVFSEYIAIFLLKCWYLSIAKGDLPNSLTNSGGADIYLIPRNGSSSKTQLSSSMYYTYAHQIAGTSISLSTSGGSVSISGGSYDYQTKIYNY